MLRTVLIVLCFSLALNSNGQDLGDHFLQYSTYFGGTDYDLSRDLFIDQEGNVYITGGTSSDDFPTTSGVHNIIYNGQGSPTIGNWGPMMVFVSKFSSSGELIWSTYLGGPSYDRAYGIEVDSDGFVYVGGRAGEGFPTTQGVFQESFLVAGSRNNLYGHQNGFITKLTPDGKSIVWSTYYGSDSFGFFRDIDVDEEGSVYGVLNAVLIAPNGISQNAFDTDHNGKYDMVAVKFSPDASQVEWATFLGGSGEDRGGPSIRVGSDKSVYVGGTTRSSDFPVTQNAIQSDLRGGSDFFVTRIAPDGESLIYSTYLGGNNDEFSETHSLELDQYGQAFIACGTSSTDLPTTAGVVKGQKPDPTDNDLLLAKLSTDGSKILACSYFGGTSGDAPEGLKIDSKGYLYVGGGTASNDLPLTADNIQPQLNGGRDGFILKLDSTFTEIQYCSYFGGSEDESIRAFSATEDGTVCIAGQTYSSDLRLSKTPFQDKISKPKNSDSFFSILNQYSKNDDLDGDGYDYEHDCDDKNIDIHPNADDIPDNGIDEDCDGEDALSTVLELSNSTISIYPNPASDLVNVVVYGQLVSSVNLYDSNGKLVKSASNSGQLDMSGLPIGIYLIEILDQKNGAKVVERIVKVR